MSDARIAGLVCEGQTDVPILREVVQTLWPEIEEVRSLQPQLDDTGRATAPAGWTQVRSWCQQNAPSLGEVLDPDLGDPIDLLVIAIDVDIAIHAGIADPPQNVGIYETTRLSTTMGRWLKTGTRRKLPAAVVLSTPVMAIEAWIIAALFPKERSPETIVDPAQWLVDKNKLRLSPNDNMPWKELYRYRSFAPIVAAKLSKVRQACVEADRTCRLVEERRDALNEAKRGHR